jgi:hypothetical protein
LNTGSGIFATVVSLDSGGFFPDWVDIVDVNGDGKPDVVVANSSDTIINDLGGNVGILLGNGDGTFKPAAHYLSGGFGAASVAVADVDGDGKLDLVVVNCSATSGSCTGGGGTVGVLPGNGDGTFQTAVTYSPGGNTPFGVAVADLNGDSKPDIVAANCVSNTCSGGNGVVGVLINTSLTATATALTSSPNPSNVGQAVTLTATVTAQPGFDKGTPTGTVNFFDGTTNIGSSSLNGSGVATLMTSTLAVGTHSITAAYSGDANFTTSTSPAVQQVVQGAQGFTLSASPTTVSISAPGQSGPTTITISTVGGLKASSVGNFACSGLPAQSNCTFGTVSSSNTVSLNITTTAASDLYWPQFGHHQQLFYAMLLPGFLGMVSMAGRRRTLRGLRLLALIVVLGLSALWLACGGSTTKTPTNSGTPAGTSTVTISATSGALKGSTTITVTVQ